MQTQKATIHSVFRIPSGEPVCGMDLTNGDVIGLIEIRMGMVFHGSFL
jgi:hypothetical protein